MSTFFQNSSLGDHYQRTRFDAMVDGRASKPFVYRQLVPILIRSIDQITVPSFRDSMNQRMEHFKTSPDYQEVRRFMPWLNSSFPHMPAHYKRLLASFIILSFWVGYMTLLYQFAGTLFPTQPAIALCAPIFATLAFSSFSFQLLFIYDIPCLFLSTACFYALYTERFRAYCLLFFLACLNKETAVFMIVFFVLWHARRMDSARFAWLLSFQCGVYALVKLYLNFEYAGNRGPLLEDNLTAVLRNAVLAPANIEKIAIIVTLWFALTFQWQDKPAFLKRTLWLFPMFYIAYLLHGFPREYRVFFDLHGPLVLLATHSLIAGTGIAAAPIFSTLPRHAVDRHAPPA